MDKVASKYLFKQLSKTKRIAESPPFAHFKESKSRIPTNGPQSPAEANVLAVGGSWLCPAADIRAGNWAGITAMCAKAMKTLKAG